MKATITLFFILIGLTACQQEKSTHPSGQKITKTHPNWVPFSSDIFKKAQNQNKFVILNLHANWCHWCHVMDDSTYSNQEVVAYMDQHYIAASADHDLRTDLAERYRAYGWPATIIFNAKGEEIVKRAGYIPPDGFLRLLKAIVKDPSPETLESNNPLVLAENKSQWIQQLDERLKGFTDEKTGGFNAYQRSVHKNTFIYALQNATDNYWKTWVQNTAINSKGLMDPVWGGIYQYSTHKSWNHPHFEKLLAIQARYMQLYSYYGSTFKDDKVKNRIRPIDNYVQRFLKSENGLYFNAQDADLQKGVHAENYFKLSDQKRLEKGIPAIDSNTYTKENAQLGIAYLSAYGATNDIAYYEYAHTILKNLEKRKKDNLYQRSENIEILPIGDQVHVAMLNLLFYELTGDLQYLDRADQTGKAIVEKYGSQNNNCFKSYIGNTALEAECIPRENYELALLFYKLSLYRDIYQQHFKTVSQWLMQSQVIRTMNDEAASMMLATLSEATTVKVEVFGNYHNGKGRSIIAPVLSWPSLNYKIVFADQNETSQDNPFGEQCAVLICGTSFCSRPFTTFEQAFQYWHQRLTFVKN